MKSAWKIVIGVSGTVTVCLAATAAWFSSLDLMSCQTHEEVIDQSNPSYSIVRTDTACDGIANSYDVSLDLISPSGRHAPIFEYGDGTSSVQSGDDSKPVIRWINAWTLRVEIGIVAYVRSRIAHAGDIAIEYKIGKIMFESKQHDSEFFQELD